MGQQGTKESAVRSPCSGVCTLDAGGKLCIGCLRSGAEIAEWPRAGDARRRQILAAVAQRRQQAGPAANQPESDDVD